MAESEAGASASSRREEDVLDRIEQFRRRRPRFDDELITLAHGAGGSSTHALIDRVFVEAFAPVGHTAAAQLDAALLEVSSGGRIAFTTDAFVVKPLRFPGGSIGHLAVHGTVNDLAVMGAVPRWLSASFVLEEGFPVAELREIVGDMAAAAAGAGVAIVTGDTKVVERGSADGLFITTAGVGEVAPSVALDVANVGAGDVVLVSGSLADHGMAVMLARGDLALAADITSDTASVADLVADVLAAAPSTRWMRDPTRGGVATVCNDLARDSGLGVVLEEADIPVDPSVAAACELLGIDPLYVANEGKVVVVVAAGEAEAALAAMRGRPEGRRATRIGEVVADPQGVVVLRTPFGGTRIVGVLAGDPLPRIC